MALTKIRQGNWGGFPREVQLRLLKLTIREESGMRETVWEIDTDYPVSHKVFVLYEAGRPVAWSIAAWDAFSVEYNVMLYVRRDRRRRGYGRRLLTKARAWVARQGEAYVVFPQPENRPFFEALNELKQGKKGYA